MPETVATQPATLELVRFEWAQSGQIEIEGRWTGLRGRRFIRPTLVLTADGGPRRLLALLDHKPWPAEEGEEWLAAFPWTGPPERFANAELNVAPGIDLTLPAPRMRPGKPRRFNPRIVSRDASLEDARAQVRGPGIVTEPVEAPAPPASATAVDEASLSEGSTTSVTEPNPPGQEQLADLRRERDAAREQVRALRAEVEAERQERERAVADARAEERSSASSMLAEGAQLRAEVERRRELAEDARDTAIEQREAAFAERGLAVEDRRRAESDRDAAFRERDAAFKERDRAINSRDAAHDARDKALDARARAERERDAAVRERDEVVRAWERGLPVRPPKPRFLPERADTTPAELWATRSVAIGLVAMFALLLIRIFAG